MVELTSTPSPHPMPPAKEIKNLFLKSDIKKNLRNIAISTFNLKKADSLQLEMFEDVCKKSSLTKAVDRINKKYGLYTIHSGRMILDSTVVQDRIAFGQS